MAEIETGMNLYEFNKSTLVKAPSATSAQMDLMRNRLRKFLAKNNKAKYYYMMFCRDIADYTLFTSKDFEISDYAEQMEEDIQDCFRNRGMEIMMIDINDDDVVEIWTRVNHPEDESLNEIYLYHIFPYDEAIIEYSTDCEVS